MTTYEAETLMGPLPGRPREPDLTLVPQCRTELLLP